MVEGTVPVTWLIAAVAAAVLVVLLWQTAVSGRRWRREVDRLGERLEGRLEASHRTMTDGLEGTTRLFGEVSSRFGEVREMATRVHELAQGVHELEEILKVPKLRGLLGEATLEALLDRVLPRHFWELQHRFADGRTVDAVIRLRDRLVPIDAKYPLEAYRRLAQAEDDAERRRARAELDRTVRERVDEIAARYIRPDEGTLDFALMYVPAEGVYAEMLDVSGALIDYALERHVIPTSPGAFYAYLSSIALGLRGLKVEQRAGEILAALATLEGEVERLQDDLAVTRRHLANAASRHENVERRTTGLLERLRSLGR